MADIFLFVNRAILKVYEHELFVGVFMTFRSSDPTPPKPVELRSVDLRAEAKAAEEIRRIDDAMWNPAVKFKLIYGGGRILLDPARGERGKMVTDTLREVHDIIMKSKKESGTSVAALAEIFAILQDSYSHSHEGRDRVTQDFYRTLVVKSEDELKEGKGEAKEVKDEFIAGKDIFNDVVTVQIFDDLHRGFSEKLALDRAARNREYLDFQVQIEKEKKNFNDLKQGVEDMTTFINEMILQDRTSSAIKSLLMEGCDLLKTTMSSLLIALTKGQIAQYKEDFLMVLSKIHPVTSQGLEMQKQLTVMLNQFCAHHETLMTDLNSRYLDLAKKGGFQLLSIAVSAAAPIVGLPLPSRISTAVTSTLEVGLEHGAKDPHVVGKANPILKSVSPVKTDSEQMLEYAELAKKWVKENPETIGLAIAGLLVSVLFPPAAPAVIAVGVARSSVTAGKTFYGATKDVREVAKSAELEAKKHEDLFCHFMNSMAPDAISKERLNKWLQSQGLPELENKEPELKSRVTRGEDTGQELADFKRSTRAADLRSPRAAALPLSRVSSDSSSSSSSGSPRSPSFFSAVRMEGSPRTPSASDDKRFLNPAEPASPGKADKLKGQQATELTDFRLSPRTSRTPAKEVKVDHDSDTPPASPVLPQHKK